MRARWKGDPPNGRNDRYLRKLKSKAGSTDHFLISPRDPVPNVLLEGFKDLGTKVADHLLEMNQRHADVMYRVVLVFDGNKMRKDLEDIEKKNNERLEFYKSKGLEDNVQLRVFDRKPLMKFDVLIIDSKHVNIGFDTSEGPAKNAVQIQNAMVWKNQPDLASKLARWYDESVWKYARPFDEWLTEQRTASGSTPH